MTPDFDFRFPMMMAVERYDESKSHRIRRWSKRSAAACVFENGPPTSEQRRILKEMDAEWAEYNFRLFEVCRRVGLKHPDTYWFEIVRGRIADVITKMSAGPGHAPPPITAREYREYLRRRSGRTTREALDGILELEDRDVETVLFDGDSRREVEHLRRIFEDLQQKYDPSLLNGVRVDFVSLRPGGQFSPRKLVIRDHHWTTFPNRHSRNRSGNPPNQPLSWYHGPDF